MKECLAVACQSRHISLHSLVGGCHMDLTVKNERAQQQQLRWRLQDLPMGRRRPEIAVDQTFAPGKVAEICVERFQYECQEKCAHQKQDDVFLLAENKVSAR